ncbi:MAG: glycosyltransferase family 2 protein [Pseudomonadota bacterium]
MAKLRFELVGGQGPEVPERSFSLGDMLVDEGHLTRDELLEAREAQALSKAPLADVLIARGMVDHVTIARTQSEIHDIGHVDLLQDRPEPHDLRDSEAEAALRNRVLPWRRIGAIPVYVTARPEDRQRALDELSPEHGVAFFAVADQPSIDRDLMHLCRERVADQAAARTPDEESVRGLHGARWVLLSVFLGLALVLTVDWSLGFAIVCAGVLGLNLLTMALRLTALIASRAREPAKDIAEGAVDLAGRRPLPKVSLLIPLYREAGMIATIAAALERLDYPRELMDVKLLCEEDDDATQLAAELADLPPWVQVLAVPAGQPRTKPRAMNAALDFCDGDVIGILDAEDRPDPGQLLAVAEHLRRAPSDVACVQCQLAYFNATENWITRCFQIEYAIWFDVLLRGFQKLGLPIPLGGTSVYFRRSALIDLNGWDAHNVTEDADLGMRLARRGLRCDVLKTVTWEEANCRALPWIRQRSRWLKGYMMTWLSHMRSPARLWRDLGPLGFAGLNILFLGGAVTYLALPVFWAAILVAVVSGAPILLEPMPGWSRTPLAVTLLAGQAVMLACAAVALWRRKTLGLIWVLPTLPVYWTLGAAAAWKAVIELIVAPYYWDKTRHGVSRWARGDRLSKARCRGQDSQS